MYAGPDIGIIGVGHLGSAILRGILRTGQVDPERITVCDADDAALAAFAQVHCAAAPEEVVRRSGLVFLCVRPQDARGLLAVLRAEGRVILSTVAGLESSEIRSATGAHVLRIMPNLPVALDEAAIAYADPNGLTEPELAPALALLSLLGTAVPVAEDDFDTVTGLSGSGPAYAYLLLEGLIAGACRRGLPQAAARELAAQTLRGAASIVLQSGRSLEELIAGVATPGGTTEAGLRVLEDSGFPEAASWAVDAAAVRAEQLSGGAPGARGSCTQLFAKDKFCE